MAISAEQLNVILTARDREFTRAMDRAQRRVEHFSKQSSKSLLSASGSFTALASAARTFLPALSAGLVVNQVRRVVAELDNIGKTADRLGLTTDALQELRVAAESAGVSTQTLDMAMQRFGRRVAEARQGAGEAKGALEEMGISLSNADGTARGTEEVLNDVADAMQGMSVQTDRNRLAMKLFDSEGVALVNMLRDGADGLDAMRKEARELGIVIDEDLIRNAEDAENQLGLMSRVISANLSQALVNLAPLLVGASRGVALLTKNINFLFSAMDDAERRTARTAELNRELEQLSATITEAEASGGGAILDEFNMGESVVNLERARARMEAIRAELAGMRSDAAAAEGPTEVVTGGADLTALERSVEAQRELARQAALTAEERERARIEAEADALVLEALAGREGSLLLPANIEAAIAASELREEYIAAATAASSILNPVKKVGGATRDAADAAEDAADKYEQMLARIIEASPALRGLGFDVENLRSTFQMVESSMEDAFMSIVDGTAKGQDAFKAMAAAIIRDLYRVLVVQRLVGTIESGRGIAGFFGRVLGAASGRSMQAGQPAVVGEHGRELFVPQTAGRVLSVAQAQNAVGGGGSVVVNQTINVSTGVQQTVRAEIKQLMPQIAESAKSAVVDAKRRGGSYGRAFS